MQFSTALVLLAPFLPSILAASSRFTTSPTSFVARRAPADFGDIGDDFDQWLDSEGAAWKDAFQGLADDVKQEAENEWDYEIDGCKAVQCASSLSASAVSCVTGSLSTDPLGCFDGVAGLTAAPKCDGCSEALDNYLKSVN